MSPASDFRTVCWRRGFLAGLAALVLLASLGGCDEVGNPIAPAVSGGRIAGRVFTGGPIPDGNIEVQGVDLPVGQDWRIRVDLDPQGRFSLDVPPGRYRVRIRLIGGAWSYYFSSTGPVSSRLDADTLIVDSFHDTGHLDFHLSSATLNLSFPNQDMTDYDARIRLFPEGSNGSYESPSEDLDGHSGNVSLVGIRPGRYRIRLEISRQFFLSGQTIWIPGHPDSATAPFFEVPVDSEFTTAYTQDTSPAHLAGRIGGGWQELGIEFQPYLSLVGLDSSHVEEIRADEDGTFAFDLFWPQPVKLHIEQDHVAQFVGGPSFADATVYDLDPGQSITDLELETATILIESSGSLLNPFRDMNGEIQIYDPLDMSLIARTHPQVTSLGTAVLPNLWPGEFLFRAVPDSWQIGSTPWYDQWYNGTQDATQAQRVILTEHGEILHLPWHLLAGGTVSGQVTTSWPDRWIDTVVTTADDAGWWAYKSDYSGTTREFAFLGLPDGEYKIGASTIYLFDGEYTTTTSWYPGTADWDSAGIITIEGAGAVEGIEISLD